MYTFEELTEEIDRNLMPPLDRDNVDESTLTSDQLYWRQNGYLILENFMPKELVDRYAEKRAKGTDGWRHDVPYMNVEEVRDISLYKPLMDKMQELIGYEMGLHLNLTGWKSTTRNWHQDDYLNPPNIYCHYAAVWFALDDIHPDSGPFQYVPGSHKWPLLRREKVLARTQDHGPDWPRTTQDFVSEACEKEIEKRGGEIKEFIASKGDVLIWHGALIHRGSEPRNPELLRKSLISHYSAIEKRIDMPKSAQHKDQGKYFVL